MSAPRKQHYIAVIDDHAQKTASQASYRFFAAVRRAVDVPDAGLRVAVDCEGVNLSRAGSVEIVSICFDETFDDETDRSIFLVDLGDAGDRNLHAERLAAVKQLFESEHVTKVIHDCRMDCDALYHHHGVRVINVHDTSCFHHVMTGRDDIGLNDMLLYHGLGKNIVRNSMVYRGNPRFWATRPLTATMKLWASSDVETLLMVAKRQLEAMTASQQNLAQEKSLLFTHMVVDMKLERAVRLNKAPGIFIGPKGCNLRALQRRTNTMLYQDRERGGDGKYWLVFYPDSNALAKVKRAMGN